MQNLIPTYQKWTVQPGDIYLLVTWWEARRELCCFYSEASWSGDDCSFIFYLDELQKTGMGKGKLNL